MATELMEPTDLMTGLALLAHRLHTIEATLDNMIRVQKCTENSLRCLADIRDELIRLNEFQEGQTFRVPAR